MTCAALNKLCRRPIVSKDRREARPKTKGFGAAGLKGENDETRHNSIDSYSPHGSYAGMGMLWMGSTQGLYAQTERSDGENLHAPRLAQ